MDEPEYNPVPPSPRSLVAQAIHKWLESEQIHCTKPAHGVKDRCWVIQVNPKGWFAAVEVFNEDYIRVIFQRRATSGKPDMKVYATMDEAIAFMFALFVKDDYEMASQVPERVPKRERKKVTPSASIEEGMFGAGNQ